MADQVVDNLVLELRIRMTALEQGLAAAGQRLDEFTTKTKNDAKQQSDAVKNSSQDQAASYAMASAAATAAFAAIVRAIKSGIDAANQYTSALTGLRSVTEGTGQDFGTMQQALSSLTADGLIPVSDAATAFKNLLSRGFDTRQAVDMLNRLKDSAAFGRQASLSMGEAVRSATEGLKNENSILVDNAGVTKNVSVMWKEYAQQIGKGVDSLTIAEKRQAEYNGIMKETRFQVGDAAKYAATFAGTQAELSAATLKAEQAFGSAMQNGLRPFLGLLTPVVEEITKFVQQNPALAAALTAGTVAFAGITIVVNGYRTAMAMAAKANIEFTASLGVIGIIAGVAAALAGLAAASENAAQSATNYTQTLRDSISAAQQEQAAIRDYQALLQKGTATTDELAAARQKIADQSPELVTGYDNEGNAIVAGNAKIQEQIDLVDEQIKAKKELLLLSADQTLRENAEKEEQAVQGISAAIKRRQDLQKEQAENEKRLASGDISGDLNGRSAEGIELRNLQIQQEIAEALEDEITARKTLAGLQSSDAQTRTIQYEAEVQSLGTLTAAQQYLVNLEMQRAQQYGYTAEQFRAYVEEAITNTDRLKAAQELLNQATADGSEAVKQWADQEKALDKIQKSNTAVTEAKKIKQYADTVKEGKKGTKEYNEALAGLAKEFHTTKGAIEGNITAYSQLADQGLTEALNAQELLRVSLIKTIESLKQTGLAGEAAAAQLAPLLKLLGQPGVEFKSGGGSARKKPWEEELDMIDRVKDAEGEYAQVYLDHIDELLQNEKLSSKERQRLEKEREYAQLQVNNELEDANIAYLQRLLQREKLTADQRLDIEKRLYEARKSMMEQYDDFADAITSAITASVEEQRDAELSAIQDSISTVNAWEQAQTDAVRAAADERIDAINDQIAALDALYKAQTRADQDATDADKMQRLQQQLAYEKDEQNRQKLTEQIAALEESISKRHAQEQLEDQKQALKDQQDAIRDGADAQIKTIEAQAKAETDALNARLKAAQDYWAARLTAESIQQQALAFLNEKTQADIIALLEKYAPEYLEKGKLLGSQLYGGLKPKIDAILDEIARMRTEAQKPITVTTVHRDVYESAGGTSGKTSATAGVSDIASRIAAFAAAPDAAITGMYTRAQRAMDNWAYNNVRPAAMAAQAAVAAGSGTRRDTGAKLVKVEQTVVLQQPVPSPYQTAKALRRESEKLAKLI